MEGAFHPTLHGPDVRLEADGMRICGGTTSWSAVCGEALSSSGAQVTVRLDTMGMGTPSVGLLGPGASLEKRLGHQADGSVGVFCGGEVYVNGKRQPDVGGFSREDLLHLVVCAETGILTVLKYDRDGRHCVTLLQQEGPFLSEGWRFAVGNGGGGAWQAVPTPDSGRSADDAYAPSGGPTLQKL